MIRCAEIQPNVPAKRKAIAPVCKLAVETICDVNLNSLIGNRSSALLVSSQNDRRLLFVIDKTRQILDKSRQLAILLTKARAVRTCQVSLCELTGATGHVILNKLVRVRKNGMALALRRANSLTNSLTQWRFS